MARMFPAIYPARGGNAAVATTERRLFTRLARELDKSWQVIHDCEIRAHGESGTVSFVLLHRDFGIALLGLAEPGEEGDPQAAVAAMRAMLGDIGFIARFNGRIAIVAQLVEPAEIDNIPVFLARCFAAIAPTTLSDPTWSDWLMQRLLPAGSTVPPPRPDPEQPAALRLELRAPEREESWRVSAASPREEAGAPMRVTAERGLRSRDLDARSPLWTGMALAVFVVAVVLVAMALLSHARTAMQGPALQAVSETARS